MSQTEGNIGTMERAMTEQDSEVILDLDTNWIQPTHCYGNTETFTLSTSYPAGTTRATVANSHGLPMISSRPFPA